VTAPEHRPDVARRIPQRHAVVLTPTMVPRRSANRRPLQGRKPAMRTDMQVMNALFHAALRRDLGRLTDVLSRDEPSSPERRAAVVLHLNMVLDLLHHHHTSEDAGLWPLVRRRAAHLTPQVDAMEAEHARIAPAIAAVRTAGAGYSRDGGPVSRNELLQAVRGLRETLLPHLDHEENEVMPQVMKALTDKDWSALARQEMRSGSSLSTAGLTLVWMADGLTGQRRVQYNRQMPALFRWFADKRYGPAYRRRARVAFAHGAQAPTPP
jgi:hemerythrin-like domain-containing protein